MWSTLTKFGKTVKHKLIMMQNYKSIAKKQKKVVCRLISILQAVLKKNTKTNSSLRKSK